MLIIKINWNRYRLGHSKRGLVGQVRQFYHVGTCTLHAKLRTAVTEHAHEKGCCYSKHHSSAEVTLLLQVLQSDVKVKVTL
jgi:hypothetical protein